MSAARTEATWSLTRSVLIAAGSYIGAAGWLNEGNVDQIIAAAMILVPLLWGVFQKFQAERKTKQREVVAVNVGIIKADNTVGPTPLESQASAPALIHQLAPIAIASAPPPEPRREP